MATSGQSEHALNGADETLELVALGVESLASRRRQRVIPGTPIVFGRSPFGLHPAVQEEPLQRGVQRALADLEDVLRHGLEALRDGVAVERPAHERPQDQQVEGAGQEIGRLIGETHASPIVRRWEGWISSRNSRIHRRSRADVNRRGDAT